jgi:uncharacterized MAPEG superfamily protein
MEQAAALPTEVVYLGWSVLLLIGQMFLQGGLAAREVGLAYNAGARDQRLKPQSVYAQRADRAYRNYLESYPAFVALALALAFAGETGGLGAVGAALWFWSRVAYVPLYVSGVRNIRSVAWFLSLGGLGLMLVRLLG